jgi:uncharacterized membrane protein/nitrite reductase/ring-hydroxylating ferredoxin subunit
MRSKANLKSHPIHPMLVGFPIAFIYGAAGFDIAGMLGSWNTAWSVGACLSVAAVVSGLAAGAAGFIDYLYVVPPRSSGKRRATWHMVVNVTALAVIALGWLFRDWDTYRPQVITLLCEVASLGLVSWGGWMGGTLAYRNQIGVDHRYAQAGKWREQVIDGQPGTMALIEGAETLKAGQMMLVRVGDQRIVVARTENGFAAFDDHCTHRGGSLADGVLACETVCCPWHGSQFSVTDGSVKAGPAEQSISVFKIEHADGQVRLQLPLKNSR